MSSQLPSLIPLDQYLADTEPSPIPDLTWDEAQSILAESDDVETQVTVVHALARNHINSRSINGKEANAVFANSPLARWSAMMLSSYDAAHFLPLDLYRFVGGAEAPSESDELLAMHH